MRDAPAPPVLHHCKGSRGLRALWALEEAQLPYRLNLLPFPPRARARDYLATNPLGTVPAFETADGLMTESSGIAHYVAASAPGSGLAVAPGEPDFALFLDYLHHADATLTFPQTVFLRFARFETKRGLEAAGEAYADWFAARLSKARARLKGREFLCADRFTAADIAVGYALHLAQIIGLGDRLGGELEAYLERLKARPGFKRAEAAEAAAEADADTDTDGAKG